MNTFDFTRIYKWIHLNTFANGKFSMKSAYNLARCGEKKDGGECSDSSIMKRFWQKLWRAKVPNKVRVFGWKACQNILPTKMNLFHRQVTDDPSVKSVALNLKLSSMCFVNAWRPKKFGPTVVCFIELRAKETLLMCFVLMEWIKIKTQTWCIWSWWLRGVFGEIEMKGGMGEKTSQLLQYMG